MKPTDYIYYAYRCKGCQRIITKPQVLSMFKGDTDRICPCGNGSMSPCNIVGLEWLLPRVWKLVLYKVLGLIAPPPEETRPVAVEPMVKNG